MGLESVFCAGRVAGRERVGRPQAGRSQPPPLPSNQVIVLLGVPGRLFLFVLWLLGMWGVVICCSSC